MQPIKKVREKLKSWNNDKAGLQKRNRALKSTHALGISCCPRRKTQMAARTPQSPLQLPLGYWNFFFIFWKVVKIINEGFVTKITKSLQRMIAEHMNNMQKNELHFYILALTYPKLKLSAYEWTPGLFLVSGRDLGSRWHGLALEYTTTSPTQQWHEMTGFHGTWWQRPKCDSSTWLQSSNMPLWPLLQPWKDSKESQDWLGTQHQAGKTWHWAHPNSPILQTSAYRQCLLSVSWVPGSQLSNCVLQQASPLVGCSIKYWIHLSSRQNRATTRGALVLSLG